MPDYGQDLTGAEGYLAPTALNCEDLKPTKNGFSFETTKECCKCHLLWKENEMVQYNGKYYGRPCGCYKDIVQLARGGT